VFVSFVAAAVAKGNVARCRIPSVPLVLFLRHRTTVLQICKVFTLSLSAVELYRKLVQLGERKVSSITNLQDLGPVDWYKNPVLVLQKIYDDK
jgi:hypothetical protein